MMQNTRRAPQDMTWQEIMQSNSGGNFLTIGLKIAYANFWNRVGYGLVFGVVVLPIAVVMAPFMILMIPNALRKPGAVDRLFRQIRLANLSRRNAVCLNKFLALETRLNQSAQVESAEFWRNLLMDLIHSTSVDTFIQNNVDHQVVLYAERDTLIEIHNSASDLQEILNLQTQIKELTPVDELIDKHMAELESLGLVNFLNRSSTMQSLNIQYQDLREQQQSHPLVRRPFVSVSLMLSALILLPIGLALSTLIVPFLILRPLIEALNEGVRCLGMGLVSVVLYPIQVFQQARSGHRFPLSWRSNPEHSTRQRSRASALIWALGALLMSPFAMLVRFAAALESIAIGAVALVVDVVRSSFGVLGQIWKPSLAKAKGADDQPTTLASRFSAHRFRWIPVIVLAIGGALSLSFSQIAMSAGLSIFLVSALLVSYAVGRTVIGWTDPRLEAPNWFQSSSTVQHAIHDRFTEGKLSTVAGESASDIRDRVITDVLNTERNNGYENETWLPRLLKLVPKSLELSVRDLWVQLGNRRRFWTMGFPLVAASTFYVVTMFDSGAHALIAANPLVLAVSAIGVVALSNIIGFVLGKPSVAPAVEHFGAAAGSGMGFGAGLGGPSPTGGLVHDHSQEPAVAHLPRA